VRTTRILITGANGQLGQALLGLPGLSGGIEWIATDYNELDITSAADVKAFAGREGPDFILNCAAYTAVDLAEKEPKKAFLINAEGPRILAIAARDTGIPLIHISTDYVFSGNSWTPYKETDATDPKSAYGKSKLAGEQAILEIGGRSVIIRTSWLYSEFGKNFFLTMLRLGKEKETIGVVCDQIGGPTYAGDLAGAMMTMVNAFHANQDWLTKPEIVHYCNAGVASWYDLSVAIMEIAGLPCKVKPISTSDYPLPAPRPAYSLMDTSRYRGLSGKDVPHWRESLADCYEKYLKNNS
jgi:dTDP-4-dehydrorhamnose reductase